MTVLGAIYHAVEHFSIMLWPNHLYHQELHTGIDLNFFTIAEGGAGELVKWNGICAAELICTTFL